MTTCPTDGSVRVVADRDANSVTWRCPFCRVVSREVHDLTRDALNTWENR